MNKKISLALFAALASWAIGIAGLLYFVEQSTFDYIFGFSVLCFSGYYWLAFRENNFSIKYLIALAVVLRIAAVFAFPALSDDIYRFIWDGRLALEGIHPFDQLPSYYLEADNRVPGLTSALFEKLNSQNYYTIYPPISQGIFYICALFFPTNIFGFAILLKAILMLADVGAIWLLWKLIKKFKLPQNQVLIYALNPLVIVEVCGNAHFEGIMISFFLLAFLLFNKSKLFLSASALAAAVAAKLLPLIFLPFVLGMTKIKDAIKYYSFFGVALILMTLPLISAVSFENFSESINLYFQKFEFNASVFYLVRWVGFQIKGWNIIQSAGPIMGMIVFVLIWLLTWLNRNSSSKDWPRLAMWALTIYLLFATIVHPWYIISLVALCTLTNYRFPVLWSGLIMMTYINYSYSPYYEPLWIVALQYSLVLGMLIFEIKKFNFTRSLELTD